MKNHLINVDKLKEIRQRLPQGSTREICKRLGRSMTAVSNTLNGKANTPGVLEEAYKIIEAENKKAAALDKIHADLIK